MSTGWIFGGDKIDVVCHIDIEQSPESFHAHAVPDGIDINPGDEVLVYGVPTNIEFGDRIMMECPATVVRANWLVRKWTEFTSIFELTELYEVGFQPKETP